MLRIIDRYFIREILPPFFLALLVFTFILQIPPVMEVAERLIAKGVAWGTIAWIMLTLLPQALGITIPMALLVGLLVALGRLSGDRETVALQACGVSVYRMLVPVLVIAALGWAATSWVMIEALPRANQSYREVVYDIVATRAENEVRPRVFFEDFPNLVLYVRDVPADGRGWQDVFLADTRRPNEPEIFLARRGRMVVDRERRRVDMVLEGGAQHRVSPATPDKYEVQRFEMMTLGLDPDSVFPRVGVQRGDNEMTIPQLRAEADRRVEAGLSPHNQVMAVHKKFSIPLACLVFAVIGLGLGVTSRKDGKQSSFVVAIAVIFIYYVFMYTGESMAKAHWIPAWLAMWIPNLVLGAAGMGLVAWRARFAEVGTSAVSIPVPFVRRRAASPSGPGADQPPAPATPTAPKRANGSRRVVVVLRVPRFWTPQARILDRYVTWFYARVFAMAFAGMLGLFYVATFIDLSDKLFKGEATGRMLLQFFWYSTPQYIYYVTPIAALVSTLVTVGLLTKSSELIVMRACGISLYRATLPLLVAGAVWSLALFALQESILAEANRQAQSLHHVIRGGSPRTFDVMNRQWMTGRDGSLYHYAYFDPRREELNGLSVYRFDPDEWRLSSRSFAGRADYQRSVWTASTGWERRFGPGSEVVSFATFDQAPLQLESAEYFKTEQPDAERMSYAQLRRYVNELKTSGFNVVPYTVELQRKLSFPFVTVIMTLIAVPFAVMTGRRGALYGVGVGIGLAITYWLLFSVFAAIGTAGLVAPVLAAWAPNILFTAGAAYLLLTVRT
jgi:LPS export ABC transporter permease LptG/LPS export ABC transporter permease LptF